MKYPAVQPVLWLLLFGEVMAQVRGVSPGNPRYLDFLSAGILAQSVLFVVIFYGITAIWERDLGVLQRYLGSPPPLSALVVAKPCCGCSGAGEHSPARAQVIEERRCNPQSDPQRYQQAKLVCGQPAGGGSPVLERRSNSVSSTEPGSCVYLRQSRDAGRWDDAVVGQLVHSNIIAYDERRHFVSATRYTPGQKERSGRNRAAAARPS